MGIYFLNTHTYTHAPVKYMCVYSGQYTLHVHIHAPTYMHLYMCRSTLVHMHVYIYVICVYHRQAFI